MKHWLKLDALNRSWRTVLQGIAVVVVFPALDAAVQVVQNRIIEHVAGAPVDWSEVKSTALKAAITAALMAIAAYLHRAKLDPSPIPSAIPPKLPAQGKQYGL